MSMVKLYWIVPLNERNSFGNRINPWHMFVHIEHGYLQFKYDSAASPSLLHSQYYMKNKQVDFKKVFCSKFLIPLRWMAFVFCLLFFGYFVSSLNLRNSLMFTSPLWWLQNSSQTQNHQHTHVGTSIRKTSIRKRSPVKSSNVLWCLEPRRW